MLEGVRALATQCIGPDEFGYRREFINLVARAMNLSQANR
jgi:hypothetical protein